MLYSLIYVSELINPEDQDTLEHIREQAIELNLSAGITGLLLHTPKHFCQLLQGQKKVVEETMERIRRDHRHQRPIVLLRTDFSSEMFPDWSMATSRIPHGTTADTIARAHTSRLARAEDIDQIITVMQQYRFGGNPNDSPVVFRSQQDRSLSALRTPKHEADSLDDFLMLGAQIFNGEMLLLIRQAGNRDLSVKTTARDIPDSLIATLTKSRDEFNIWCAQSSVAENKTSPPESKTNTPEFIATLRDNCGYQSAIGYLLRLGLHSDSQVRRAKETFPAAMLWLLKKQPDQGAAIAPVTASTQQHYVGCLEHLLDQRRLVFESDLLKQQSQRQQLAIAANLVRQELVLNVASSAILAFDADCHVLMINQAARTLFNLTDQEVPIRWPNDIEFLDVDRETLLDGQENPVYRAVAIASDHAQTTGNRQTLFENTVVGLKQKSSSRAVALKCSAVSVSDPDSAVTAVVVFDDITELERNRERMRRNDRLEALGHLTGGIAHDFNNLLATVLNAVELASIETRQPARQHLHELAIDTVQRGTELTRRLVAFAVAQPIKPEIHRVTDILKAVEELAMASVSSDINLTIAPVADDIAVLCDAGQLENALLNLLINSRDAITSSGVGNNARITVQIRQLHGTRPDTIEICVMDDGPGMSSSDIQKATDPFFTTKHSKTGSGLGLSMVYRFIQQSDAELVIENIDGGHGTGLRVSMLFDQTSVPDDVLPARPKSIAKTNNNTGTVLLVEDDSNLATVLQKSLQHLGYRVLLSPNSEHAMQWFTSEQIPDILLTDVVMPGSKQNGFMLADTAIKLKPDLKIVYMSGYVKQPPDDTFKLYGPLLSKPVRIGTLSEALENALQADSTLAS